MSSKNIHSEPFDKGTITKLEIFEDYTQAWIPTFVMQKGVDEIHIFDFFSGPGYDINGIPGSPIRILQKIDEQLGNFLAKKTKIVVHFNEFQPKRVSQPKFEALKENCEKYISEHPKFKYFLSAKYYNKDAGELFIELLPIIRLYPSLVFLDQNGVKFISEEYINKLDELKTTDFLFFVSSSFFRRYGTTDEFKKALEIDIDELEKSKYSDMHRLVVNKVKSRLPPHSKTKIFPYSIKKNTNIYGILFGSKSYTAVDKFLSIGWKRNELNGEADFDIDQDLKKGQLDMFSGKKLTKIENFQNELKEYLRTKEEITNKEIIIYTYEQGHIPKHAVALMKKLKSEKLITLEGSHLYLNYINVFRKKNIVTYQININ